MLFWVGGWEGGGNLHTIVAHIPTGNTTWLHIDIHTIDVYQTTNTLLTNKYSDRELGCDSFIKHIFQSIITINRASR